MMITKSQFVNVINVLKKNENFIEELTNLNRKYDTHIEFETPMESTIIKLLEIIFNDSDYISWWIWETNFGQCCIDEPIIWDENNNPIDVSTTELFYDFLIDNMNCKKENEEVL